MQDEPEAERLFGMAGGMNPPLLGLGARARRARVLLFAGGCPIMNVSMLYAYASSFAFRFWRFA